MGTQNWVPPQHLCLKRSESSPLVLLPHGDSGNPEQLGAERFPEPSGFLVYKNKLAPVKAMLDCKQNPLPRTCCLISYVSSQR